MAKVYPYVFMVDGEYGSRWCLLMTVAEYEALDADNQLQWITEVIALDNGPDAEGIHTYTIISN